MEPEASPSRPAPPRRWRLVILMALRVLASWTLLLAAYFLLPTMSPGGSDAPWLALALCAYVVVVAVMVPAIIRSPHPLFRGIETLALIIPLFLLIFARVYLSNSLGDPAGFSEILTRSSALYFTVTVFATVGFGDIVAQTDGLRLLVTVQMLGNLIVLGGVVRLISVAARRGAARRGAARRGSARQGSAHDRPSPAPPEPEG